MTGKPFRLPDIVVRTVLNRHAAGAVPWAPLAVPQPGAVVVPGRPILPAKP